MWLNKAETISKNIMFYFERNIVKIKSFARIKMALTKFFLFLLFFQGKR